MNTSFEQFLIETGFIRHKRIGGKLVPTSETNFSTMRNLSYVYVRGDRKIEFGLNQRGLPPTLISPRPFVNKRYITDDHEMNQLLKKYTPAEIFEALFDHSKKLTL